MLIYAGVGTYIHTCILAGIHAYIDACLSAVIPKISSLYNSYELIDTCVDINKFKFLLNDPVTDE